MNFNIVFIKNTSFGSSKVTKLLTYSYLKKYFGGSGFEFKDNISRNGIVSDFYVPIKNYRTYYSHNIIFSLKIFDNMYLITMLEYS